MRKKWSNCSTNTTCAHSRWWIKITGPSAPLPWMTWCRGWPRSKKSQDKRGTQSRNELGNHYGEPGGTAHTRHQPAAAYSRTAAPDDAVAGRGRTWADYLQRGQRCRRHHHVHASGLALRLHAAVVSDSH